MGTDLELSKNEFGIMMQGGNLEHVSKRGCITTNKKNEFKFDKNFHNKTLIVYFMLFVFLDSYYILTLKKISWFYLQRI